MAPNAVLEVIRRRRSVRSFRDEPVPPEILEQLLEAACWAPSAGNLQPWQVLCGALAGKKEAGGRGGQAGLCGQGAGNSGGLRPAGAVGGGLRRPRPPFILPAGYGCRRAKPFAGGLCLGLGRLLGRGFQRRGSSAGFGSGGGGPAGGPRSRRLRRRRTAGSRPPAPGVGRQVGGLKFSHLALDNSAGFWHYINRTVSTRLR